MATTHVSIPYGGKQLDCELSYEPPYAASNYLPQHSAQDCEFTLEKVSLVIVVKISMVNNLTHLEDMTSFLYHDQFAQIEELAINAIHERGYV